MSTPPDPYLQADSSREPFSLVPLLTTLWSYRRPAVLALIAVILAYTLFALVVTLRAPVERVASVGFRLLFEGAGDGEYPNGDPFSVADITSSAVLERVHHLNDLERYMPVGDLSSALVVAQASPELIILTRAYDARLSNPALTQVARTEIEAEFLSRREALRVPELSLRFVQNSRVRAMPDTLVEKVLLDVLATWSEFSRDRRGVQTYAIEIFSDAAVDETGDLTMNPMIRLDLLRRRVDQLIQQSDAMSLIPGVQALRSATTKQTLGEVRAYLDDLRGFRLNLALQQSLQNASGAEAQQIALYLSSRVSEVERLLQRHRTTLGHYTEALRVFSADSIPTPATGARPGQDPRASVDTQPLQLSESFLTTLMGMARRQEDFEYRRNLAARIFETGGVIARLEGDLMYYQSARASLNGAGRTPGQPATEAFINPVMEGLKVALNAQSEIFQQISALHLDRGGLYRVVVGYSSVAHRGVMGTSLLFAGLTVLLLALILIPLACLAHHTFWVRRRT